MLDHTEGWELEEGASGSEARPKPNLQAKLMDQGALGLGDQLPLSFGKGGGFQEDEEEEPQFDGGRGRGRGGRGRGGVRGRGGFQPQSQYGGALDDVQEFQVRA